VQFERYAQERCIVVHGNVPNRTKQMETAVLLSYYAEKTWMIMHL